MTNEVASNGLVKVFWRTWQEYWRDKPEGEIPLVYAKPLLDGDFVFMAPIHHEKLKQIMVALADDPKFALFEYGDWAHQRWNYFGVWSAFVVSARHTFWKALVEHARKTAPQSDPE